MALRYNRAMLMRSIRIAWTVVLSAVVATALVVLIEMAGLNLVNLAE